MIRRNRLNEAQKGKVVDLSAKLQAKHGDSRPGEPVYTNNGYYALEKDGVTGFGTWVGYVHGKGINNRKAKNSLADFAYGNAVYDFAEEIEEITGEKTYPDKVLVIDKTAATDMYQLFYPVEDDDTKAKFLESVTRKRRAYSRRRREAVVPFEELNSYTKQMIEEIAEDDYYMNHRSSANDVIDDIYGDDEISSKLARAVADYYDEVYDRCEAEDLDAQWNDEESSYGCDD